jgi:hypothetical protein
MKFVILLPFAAVRNVHEWCEGGRISDWAVAAGSARFDAVAVTDHPFPSDAWMGAGGRHAFDPCSDLSRVGSG